MSNIANDSTELLSSLGELLKKHVSTADLIPYAVNDFQIQCAQRFKNIEESVRATAMAEATSIVAEAKREVEAWEVEKVKLSMIQHFEPKIKLDVGGNRFTTFLTTLRRFPDTMIGAMFSGRHAFHLDEEGYYFIDRDGTHFRYILNFLRSPETFECDLTGTALKELKNECDYYNLKAMMFPWQPVPAFVCYNSLAQPVRVTQDETGVWSANNYVLKLCEHCCTAEYSSSTVEEVNNPFSLSSNAGAGFSFGNSSTTDFGGSSYGSTFGNNGNTGFVWGTGNNTSFGSNTGFGNNNNTGFSGFSFGNISGGTFGGGNTGWGSGDSSSFTFCNTNVGNSTASFGNSTGGFSFGVNNTGGTFGSVNTRFGGNGNNTSGFTFNGGNGAIGSGQNNSLLGSATNTGSGNAGFTFSGANGNTTSWGNGSFGANNNNPGFAFGSGGGTGFGNGTGGWGNSGNNDNHANNNANNAGINSDTAAITNNDAASIEGCSFAMPVLADQHVCINNFRNVVETKGGDIDFSVQPKMTEKCRRCNRSPSPLIDEDM